MCHTRKWQQYLGRGHQGQSGSARSQTHESVSPSLTSWLCVVSDSFSAGIMTCQVVILASASKPKPSTLLHTNTHTGAEYHAALQRTERRVWLFGFSTANRSDLCSQTQRRVREGCVHHMAGHPVCPHLLLCEERNVVFFPQNQIHPLLSQSTSMWANLTKSRFEKISIRRCDPAVISYTNIPAGETQIISASLTTRTAKQ